MRPSWQTDLKWAAGLLACVTVVAAGVLFSLAHLTSHDSAVPLSTAIIAAGISDRVSDEDYARVQAAAVANPDATISLAPLTLTATGREIAGLSKDAAARLFAGRLADVLYEKGDGDARALIVQKLPDPDKKPLSLGPAGILSSSEHSTFNRYFTLATVLSLVLLAVVALMGRGFGRLGAPAVIVAVGALPLAALWFAAGKAIGTGDPNGNPAIFAARAAALADASDLRSTFVIVVVVSGALAISALVAGVGLNLYRRVRQSDATSAPEAPVGLAGVPHSFTETEPAA